ncbi:MAG: hypothetical protein ABGW50_06920 [Thermococcus sp.]
MDTPQYKVVRKVSCERITMLLEEANFTVRVECCYGDAGIACEAKNAPVLVKCSDIDECLDEIARKVSTMMSIMR